MSPLNNLPGRRHQPDALAIKASGQILFSTCTPKTS